MKRYWCHHLWLLPVLAAIWISPAAALEMAKIQRQGLSEEQASEILVIVLRHERIPEPPATSIERLTDKNGKDLFAGYFSFGVSSDSPNAAATTKHGLFAISRQTADVWEMNLCRRFRFAKLAKIQAMVMRTTGKRFKDEQTERIGLGCGNG